jgi:hypothetical protein
MQYFAILRVELTGSPSATAVSVVTVNQHVTRQQIYKYMADTIVEQYGEQYVNANIVFFTAEPNNLG